MGLALNFLYLLAWVCLFPWLLYKILTTGKYRRGLWSKLSGRAFLRVGDAPCVWFHGVSVGEIHLLRQVVAEFRRRHPTWQCVVSTTTDTGFDEARKHFADVAVFFWPLDFTWAVRRALRRVRPTLVVLAESEMWPNFVRIANNKRVRLAVINGRMSPRSMGRYQKLGRLTRPLFQRLDLYAVQTEEYASAVRALGAPNVLVTGSVKYDGASTDANNPKTRQLKNLLGIGGIDLVWIAGSTQAPEEQVVLDVFTRARAEHPGLRLIVVPRQKERFDEVAELLRRSGHEFVRRSQLAGAITGKPIILVDTFGELATLWGLADLAYVGGSLDGKRGGQNMIEPAAFGAAVVFGPHTWNFKETVARLLDHAAAIQVRDAADLEREVMRLLGNSAARRLLGQNARQFALSQQGATRRTLDALDELLGIAPLAACA